MVGMNKGFSVIEVMLASVILAIGILSITQVFYISIQKNIAFRDQTLATSLAQDKIEEIMRTNYGALTTANFPSESFTVGSVPFSREVLITDNWPQQNMKGILVIACTGLGKRTIDKRCAQLDLIRQQP